jgi:DNA invertase Pin-like site-specific DNA recombinase
MRVVAYVTGGEAARAKTAKGQREQVERWASRNGAAIVALHEDAGVAEGALFRSRPALMDALSVLRAEDRVEALLIASRGWLDSYEEAVVEGLARRAGGRVIAADGTRASPAVERLVATCETYARALTSVGTRAKRREWQARGAPYGQVPWGYRPSADGTRVVRDRLEQRVLSVVAHMRASGFKLHEIADELARAGLRTRGGGPITVPRVSELLREIEERPMYEHVRRVLVARKQPS